jgi:hypothetical protein
MRLELGTRVSCSDGHLGELGDLVVDPKTNHVTHLVVQPHHQHDEARLVPAVLAQGADEKAAEILLRCTVAEARDYARVEEYASLRPGEFPTDDPGSDMGIQTVLATPYYDASGLDLAPVPLGDGSMIYDRIPKGAVEIRRASAVQSADGHHLGHVEAFLVDSDNAIEHVVLARGHLWGRRDVTIPIAGVAKTATDVLELSLTKDEVGALPSARA